MKNLPKWLYIIILIIAAAVIAGGYFYWKSAPKPADEPILEEEIQTPPKAENPAASGTLPSMNTDTNVLKDIPEINPVSKINPFKDIYKNPFE